MMETKIEKEYKMMITKQQFEDLKSFYPYNVTNNQINYYYDSKPSAYARGFAIRIRELNGEFIFTLKESVPEGKLEYEFVIEKNDINDQKIKNVLDSLHLKDQLFMIGTLKTIRHIYRDEFGELCLDENHYLQKVDYEVEYELFDHTMDKLDHFINLLKKCNIDYVPNKLSKLKRFRLSME